MTIHGALIQPTTADITSKIDDLPLQDASVAIATNAPGGTPSEWLLAKTNGDPPGPTVLLTQSGIGRWTAVSQGAGAAAYLSAYYLGPLDQNVAPGANVLFDTLAVPVVGTAFTYSTVTGVVTFLTAGTYDVIYGASTGSAGALGGVIDPGTVVLPQSVYYIATPTVMSTMSFGLTATAGQKLSIRNLDAASTISLDGANDPTHPSVYAFLIVKRIA